MPLELTCKQFYKCQNQIERYFSLNVAIHNWFFSTDLISQQKKVDSETPITQLFMNKLYTLFRDIHCLSDMFASILPLAWRKSVVLKSH